MFDSVCFGFSGKCSKLFQSDPTMALNYMSHDDCRGMLDANELSSRFDNDNEE